MKELVPGRPLPSPSPATCAPHLPPHQCHLASYLACNCITLHTHTALTSDMTCLAQLLHTRCHIRKGEVKKVWVVLHCVGGEPFVVAPTCRSTSCLRALQESPQRPFGEPQTLNHGGYFPLGSDRVLIVSFCQHFKCLSSIGLAHSNTIHTSNVFSAFRYLTFSFPA